MKPIWPWVALAGLGAFHGLNPAMGWLFAVALGLHRHSRASVLLALPSIALGHALSIAIVAAAFVAAGVLIDPRTVQISAGLFLIGWAIYHQVYGHRHRVRVGMKTGLAGLVLWSFLMATAHGAGLMVVPVLLAGGAQAYAGTAGHDHAHGAMASSPLAGFLAAAIHTAAYLAVTGLVAWIVYRKVGLAILRKAWFNVDALWALALVATGLITFLM